MTDVRPGVSVLLPVRDAAAFVVPALESLQAQTHDDLEIVVVDDGSEDETAKVVRRVIGGRGRRLRLLTPGRVGLVRALELGLAACRAELVARMDADDIAEPQRLERQHELLAARPDLAVAGCLVRCFAEPTIGEGYRVYESWVNSLIAPEEIAREIFIESPLPHPSVMFRRSAVLSVGGYRDRGWPEDYDLWLRAARCGLRMGKVPEVLLRWRDHPDRHSRRHSRYSRAAFIACKVHHLVRGPLARGESARGRLVLWGAGWLGRRFARRLAAEGWPVSHFVDIDPRKLGSTAGGVPVIGPEELGPPAGRLLLAAVGTRGARDEIRSRLGQCGWREGQDFLCLA